MTTYFAYVVKHGRVCGREDLDAPTDDEAKEKARLLLGRFSQVNLMQGDRLVAWLCRSSGDGPRKRGLTRTWDRIKALVPGKAVESKA